MNQPSSTAAAKAPLSTKTTIRRHEVEPHCWQCLFEVPPTARHIVARQLLRTIHESRQGVRR